MKNKIKRLSSLYSTLQLDASSSVMDLVREIVELEIELAKDSNK